MEKRINFEVMGFNEKDSETLNWCARYLDNLEVVKRNKVMEIWEQERAQGTATLSFNEKSVLLRVSKNLFS